jgi:hypothetical protein
VCVCVCVCVCVRARSARRRVRADTELVRREEEARAAVRGAAAVASVGECEGAPRWSREQRGGGGAETRRCVRLSRVQRCRCCVLLRACCCTCCSLAWCAPRARRRPRFGMPRAGPSLHALAAGCAARALPRRLFRWPRPVRRSARRARAQGAAQAGRLSPLRCTVRAPRLNADARRSAAAQREPQRRSRGSPRLVLAAGAAAILCVCAGGRAHDSPVATRAPSNSAGGSTSAPSCGGAVHRIARMSMTQRCALDRARAALEPIKRSWCRTHNTHPLEQDAHARRRPARLRAAFCWSAALQRSKQTLVLCVLSARSHQHQLADSCACSPGRVPRRNGSSPTGGKRRAAATAILSHLAEPSMRARCSSPPVTRRPEGALAAPRKGSGRGDHHQAGGTPARRCARGAVAA